MATELKGPGFHFDVHTDLRADQKAEVLIDALPWLEEFAGQRIVVKYGGNAWSTSISSVASPKTWCFCGRWACIRSSSMAAARRSRTCSRHWASSRSSRRPARHHSGGMDVVRMVLTGKVSRELVGLINAHGPFAVGLSGEDGALFSAMQRKPIIDGKLPTSAGG